PQESETHSMRWRRCLHLLLSVVALLTAGASQRLGAGAQEGQQTQQAPPAPRKLVLVDRTGKQELIAEIPGNVWGPRVSPDGRQLVLTLTGRTREGDITYVSPPMKPGEMRPLGPGRNPACSHAGPP